MIPEHLQKAIDDYVRGLGQWLTPDRAYEMVEIMLERRPQICVEIGTFRGQSMLAQGFAMRHNFPNGDGKLYCIDPWAAQFAVEGENTADNDKWWTESAKLEIAHTETMRTIWDHHLEKWVVIIRTASQYAFDLFPHNIDQLYIDGNHSELTSTADVTNYVPRVKPGGTIFVDDTSWATLANALRLVETMATLEKDGETYRIYRKR